MSPPELHVIGVPGLPEVSAGDCLGDLIAEAIRRAAIQIQTKDIVVVSQKIVSKAEGRMVRLDSIRPSPLASDWAKAHGKDPRLVEVVLSQARRVVRMDRGVLIVETYQGFVCANGGVDVSNTQPGTVTLLPTDPDASAEEIRRSLEQVFPLKLAVIVSDTFGRPWREGLVNVALGVAGINPLRDYRGGTDSWGQPLTATVIALADELAAAAELVMGKTRGIPVTLIRGVDYSETKGPGRQMIRPAERDLFR
jgi:coenzyme F420-0:L-glutamate ligase / coenzyme F420-1:gamma-L-glutamate ligase